MITIKCPETGKENYLSNEDVYRIIDGIHAQMQNYNRAIELCPETNVIDQIKRAKNELQRISSTILGLLPDNA